MEYSEILWIAALTTLTIFFGNLTSPLIKELVYERKGIKRFFSFTILTILPFLYFVILILIINNYLLI